MIVGKLQTWLLGVCILNVRCGMSPCTPITPTGVRGLTTYGYRMSDTNNGAGISGGEVGNLSTGKKDLRGVWKEPATYEGPHRLWVIHNCIGHNLMDLPLLGIADPGLYEALLDAPTSILRQDASEAQEGLSVAPEGNACEP